MYAPFLRIWLRFFPRDSFLIINSEDYFRDDRGVICKARGGGKLAVLGILVEHKITPVVREGSHLTAAL